MEIKVKLIDLIKEEIQLKIQDSRHSYQMAKDSRDGDTKSSAGDKYETGREMMQKEMDKSASLIRLYESQLAILNQIDVHHQFHQVKQGALVSTEQGLFFISIGLGKLRLDELDYFVISLDSPIGIVLKNQQVGDVYSLNDKQYKILKID